MKITFDSNVWRKVVSPEEFPKEPSIESFKIIGEAIKENRVTAFICETVFTLEAIKRKERKDFFSDYKAEINLSEEDGGHGGVNLSFSIGPDLSAHPGNNDFLGAHLRDAISIGFKIIKLPRIGGIVNPDIENFFYKHDDLEKYHEKVFSISNEIESKKAGIFHIKNIGEKYSHQWTDGIEKAPEHENGHISKAIAEWADGDSVACHLAVESNFFCTRDVAKKAGDTSVLSEKNVQWLKEGYNFKVISPEELAIRIQECNT